jgi:hypothetical protein
MSIDWPVWEMGEEPIVPKQELPATKRYPICPECGENTIVAFTPPREGIVGTEEGYRLLHEGSPSYVDWHRAHLYCCNGSTNCKVEIPILTGLSTPVMEKRRRFKELPSA